MTTIAAFLDIGIYLLFIFIVLVCLLLLVVILMQRPKQEGLGAAFGAALTDQAFGARTTDVLKKATIYLGTLFMLGAFVLGILLNKKYKNEQKEISLQQIEQKANEATEEKKAEQPKSIADMVEQADKKEAPAQQPAPSPAPQAPDKTSDKPADATAGA